MSCADVDGDSGGFDDEDDDEDDNDRDVARFRGSRAHVSDAQSRMRPHELR
jgi:hypothetical protein